MFGSLKALALAAIGLVLALAVTACGGTSEAGDDSLTLVAYSTPQEAYEEIIPAFNETPEGKDVSFEQSYGASGDQANAILSGLEADLAALSREPDITKLVDDGLAAPDWNQDRYDGFVTNSVVVFAVRPGNPKNIQTWDDLVTGDVEIITPNPFTSGGAQWNLMAAYGAQIEQGRSPAQALAYLRDLLEHTAVQDKSARESLQTFAGGKGDVLLSYENEAITAQAKGVDLDYVVPDETILIQNPVAAVETSKSPEKATAFVKWLREPEAQRIFGEKGYRSVREDLVDKTKYPTPSGLFEIGKVGGWSKVNDEFFDPQKGSVAAIERDLGVSTAK
jgi:sulfate/thiosulfate transport system substrate-binding protein